VAIGEQSREFTFLEGELFLGVLQAPLVVRRQAPRVGWISTDKSALCDLMIHLLILVPAFFVLMKERPLRRGTLRPDRRSKPSVW
jgi:hypothetical protein